MPTKGEVERCPHCGKIISLRKIVLFMGLLVGLKKVYKWCERRGVHEFQTKEVRVMIGPVVYSKFGDLVLFGGLVYKLKKGVYGLNMERCAAFFANTYLIPSYIMKNPVTKETTAHEYRSFKDLPNIAKFLNEDGDFIAEYASENPDFGVVQSRLN